MTNQPAQPEMTPANHERNNETSKAATGPGASLRAGREAKNMSASQVASLLRLDTAVVVALDNDAIEKLPAATFVKGYLRSYARLLGLDGEQLVQQYQNLAGAENDNFKVAAASARKPLALGRWLWLLLSLGLIFLLAWYWSKPTEQPVSTDVLRSDASLVEPVAVEAPIPLPAPVAVELEPEQNNMLQDDDNRDEIIEQLLPDLRQALETSSAEPVREELVVETTEAIVAESSVVSVAAPEEEPAADSGLLKMQLIALEDSWISIRDAREQRVYRNLLRAGNSRNVSGQAPLVVHFGNAQGVELRVDGQAFDHSAWHKSNGTARFVLNAAP